MKTNKPDWLIKKGKTIKGKYESYRMDIIDFSKLAKANIQKNK